MSRRIGFQFLLSAPPPSLRPSVSPQTCPSNTIISTHMACLVIEHPSHELSSPLSIEFSLAVVRVLFHSHARLFYPPPLLISNPIIPHAIINSPSLRGPPIFTFFSQDPNCLATHSRPLFPKFPTRRRGWTLKWPRNSNSVLSIEWLSLYSYSSSFSSVLDSLFALFALWPTSIFVSSCHINHNNQVR
jgi:hypothetical protein